MNEQSQLSVVGIDVSKETLDAYHLSSKKYKKVGNNKKGFKEIITWAKKHNTRLVLCEATGGDQHKLVIALTNDEIRVNVANPTHIRYFAKSVAQTGGNVPRRLNETLRRLRLGTITKQ